MTYATGRRAQNSAAAAMMNDQVDVRHQLSLRYPVHECHILRKRSQRRRRHGGTAGHQYVRVDRPESDDCLPQCFWAIESTGRTHGHVDKWTIGVPIGHHFRQYAGWPPRGGTHGDVLADRFGDAGPRVTHLVHDQIEELPMQNRHKFGEHRIRKNIGERRNGRFCFVLRRPTQCGQGGRERFLHREAGRQGLQSSRFECRVELWTRGYCDFMAERSRGQGQGNHWVEVPVRSDRSEQDTHEQRTLLSSGVKTG